MKRALAYLVLAATVVAACGGNTAASPTPSATASATATPKPIQVGLVTDVGGLNDKSSNQAANTGRLNAEKDLASKTTGFKSRKKENSIRNLTPFVRQNSDLAT